jgi:hypothetical protein
MTRGAGGGAPGGSRGVPWTSAERALERTLRRVDAVAREGELEGFLPDPEVRAICREARSVADRIREQRGSSARRDRSSIPAARRAALAWLQPNRGRILRVLGRLRSARDVDGLVGCLAGLESAAGSRLQPLDHIRATGRWRLGRFGAGLREYEYEPEDDLIPPWELITWRIAVPPTGRGVTKADRLRAQALAQRLGATDPIDVGHVTPHVFTQPGDVVRVRPQTRRRNRAEGRAIARAAAARRAASGRGLPVRPR